MCFAFRLTHYLFYLLSKNSCSNICFYRFTHIFFRFTYILYIQYNFMSQKNCNVYLKYKIKIKD
jgi:hypothetical protein